MMSSRCCAGTARSTRPLARYGLDASFLLEHLVPGNWTPAVIARWHSFSSADQLVAPSLLRAECTSVLSRRVHAREIDEADARLQVQRMLRLPISIVEDLPLYPRAFDIARSLGWAKAYDALYLATAEYEAAELLTVDGGMRDAAVRMRIPVTLVR